MFSVRLKPLILYFVPLLLLLRSPVYAGDNTFTAIITSDLHFTVGPTSPLVIPAMSCINEIADAIVEEVIDRHPDVFIMTGDNTNSGSPEDEKILAEKLSRIRDAGIPVILTTGNHDFNRSDPSVYEENYSVFLSDAIARDPDSLSCVYEAGPFVFLAMDDNAVTLGGEGQFSEATMQWLAARLGEYEDRKVIFLSHHTVLLGKGSPSSRSYRIQNGTLLPLLKNHGVRLILCGHLHAQVISSDDDLYEIVSSMPVSGSHNLGVLTLKGDTVSYRTEQIDFKSYTDSDTQQKIAEADHTYGDFYTDILSDLVESQTSSKEEHQAILSLLKKFVLYYSDGSLYEHREEILADPYFEEMVDILWDYNYGPWIRSSIDSALISSRSLTFSY